MEITFNKEKYGELIDKKITLLLSSTLININPLNCSDEQIKDFIENKPVVEDNGYISEFNQVEKFCTFVRLDQTMEHEYQGVQFKTLLFRGVNQDFSLPEINYSQFRYDMHPIGDVLRGSAYNEYIPANVKCTINSNEMEPSNFAHGQQLFYIYSFPTLNSYHKEKRCYRFGNFRHFANADMETIRQAIVQTQWFVLKQLLERTRLFTIPTFFFFKDQRLGDPAISEEVTTYFEQYFNHNYRKEFKPILDEIESVMNNEQIACPDKYWV